MSYSYRNQSIDWFCKSINWFQCDNDIGRQLVKIELIYNSIFFVCFLLLFTNHVKNC